MRTYQLFVFVLCGLAGACCRIPQTASQLPISAKPLWTTDLRSVGYSADQWTMPAEFEAIRQIAFGSNSELLITNDSGPFANPNQVTGFVLSTKNGSVLARAAWVSKGWPFVFATSKGRYAVVTDTGMELFDRGLRQSRTSISEVAANMVSPDGRYLAVSKTIPGHGVIYFLDANTLKPTGTEIRDTYAWSTGDNRIAATATRAGKTIVEFADGRQSVEYESNCGGVRPQFVTPDLVALLGCNAVEVVSVSGAKLFSQLLMGAPTYLVATARDAGRFVVSQQFDRAGDPPSICSERFTVFDLNLRRAIFVTDSTDLRGHTVGPASGYALSPDGTLLAINTAGRVRLFTLPPW